MIVHNKRQKLFSRPMFVTCIWSHLQKKSVWNICKYAWHSHKSMPVGEKPSEFTTAKHFKRCSFLLAIFAIDVTELDWNVYVALPKMFVTFTIRQFRHEKKHWKHENHVQSIDLYNFNMFIRYSWILWSPYSDLVNIFFFKLNDYMRLLVSLWVST